jgi:hypothetical protein
MPNTAQENMQNQAAVVQSVQDALERVAQGTQSGSSVSNQLFAQTAADTTSFVGTTNQPAGKLVVFTNARLASTGWIAVHEDIDGELGNVLGARSFGPGEYTMMPVPLLRGTVPGGTYHVGIYKDNGDLKFDRKIDVLLRAEDGEMIGSSFVAQ